MKAPSNGFISNSGEEGKVVSAELWHACAGPLVNVPPVGSLVVYFPQGHSEQVAASMQKEIESIPSYSNLPSKLVCLLHNVTLHADLETDEVYAQMTLQPVNKFDRDALLSSEMALKQSRQPTEFFCKTLTASDTSTHGGFSVPRRAAEKIFPPLDFSMQPPVQELVAKDLHGHAWTFRHIYRGQPKRHLLTTGWSVFVSSKRLFAGDSVLFIRDEKSQLLLGIRRANRQQLALASSVISSDSMHIGILAAAAHAAANNSPFTIFYNPRASPAEFVVPFAKYNKAMYTQVSLGMRFRMMFETEECGVRRYMGTVTGISDLDPVRWKNSQWRNLQVGWDESTAGDCPNPVSVWDIEPVVSPFYICPPFFRPKFPKQPGFPDDESDIDNMFKRGMPWIGDEFGLQDVPNSLFPGLNLVQWMSKQQNNQFSGAQPAFFPSTVSPSLLHGADNPSKLLNFQSPMSIPNHSYSKASAQQTQTSQLQQSAAWSQNQGLQNQLSSPHNPQLQKQQLQPQQQSSVASQKQQIPQNVSQNSQRSSTYSQRNQQQLLGDNNQAPQNHPINKDSVRQKQLLLQDSLSQMPSGLQNLSEHQLQIQLLQKLQEQQNRQQQSPNLLSPVGSQVQSQVIATTQKLATQQNHQLGAYGNAMSSSLMHSSQIPGVPFQEIRKTTGLVRSQSCPTDVDPTSCPTSPSNTRQISPSSFLNRSQTVQTMLVDHPVVEPNENLVQNRQDKSSNARIKHQLPTSFGLDANALQQNLSIPKFGLDSDVQSQQRNNLPLSTAMDVTPDTLLSRDFDSGKEFHNMFSNYNGNAGDMEAELSAAAAAAAAAMNSQTFGVLNIPFKSGCSNDVQINDPTVLGGGIWPAQAPRIRTYTKVQKRGSVGRCIDVTRYKGYDELRRDLACMFGIEGQLEDTQRTEWKLVYVDHESDILLVGDDPWDEFVNCVQGIKILSTAEVQQMSLNGDLGSAPILLPNQASSGNLWKGQYEDNSAASFNR